MNASSAITAVERQAGEAALRRCVACSADTFAAETWGKAPLLSRAEELGSDFTDLFDEAAVDELVSARGLRTPFLRMAKEGTVRPASAYTRGGGAGAAIADQAADDKVLATIADGATLILQGLHRTWPPLVDFGSRLADELGHPVQINAYITPPESQGFSPHHDVHDVFVLQVAGRKHWTVHRPVVDDPLDSQPFDRYKPQIAARVAEPPLLDTVLAPGDALYLPRGTIHSAAALGEISIHLTIGVQELTRHLLAQYLLEAARDDAELRASLPMGVDLSDPEVLAPLLAETVAALQASIAAVPATEIAEKVGTNLMRRTRPAAIGPLAQLAAAESLGLDTPLRRRDALRLRLVTDDSIEGTRIVLLDRSIDLPASTQAAVELAVSGRPFTPGDLPELEPEDQLTFCRRLLREGVAVPE